MLIRLVVVGAALVIACGGATSVLAGTTGVKPQGPTTERPDCSPASTLVCPCPASASDSDAASGRFGVELLAAVSGEGRTNALVSPLGIGAVLAMLSQGAVEPVRRSIREMLGDRGIDQGGREGETAESLATAESPGAGDSEESGAAAGDRSGAERGTGDSETPSAEADGTGPAGAMPCRLAAVLAAAAEDQGVALHVANGAFADRRLDLFPSFSSVLRDRFGARVERLDFAASDSVPRINAWVARETANAIPSLVSSLEPDAALVLANAMHFHGEWSRPFDPAQTAPLPFHPHAGEAIEVATMQAEELSVPYREDADFQAVALPYGGGAFALVVVLPRAGLEPAAALRALASDPSWLGGSDFHRMRGYLALPRVSLDAEASLLPALRALGLASALDDADAFAGIAAPPPALSRVVHRTMLKLDEQGTEAAAATAAIMTTRAAIMEDEGFEMQVDRPFALAVHHRATGALLFAAWVADPTGG